MNQRISDVFAPIIRLRFFYHALSLFHILLGTYLVYLNPRSAISFLVFISSFYTVYKIPVSWRFKLVVGAVLALVIVPVIGVRNIFYLEIMFQISVFAALASVPHPSFYPPKVSGLSCSLASPRQRWSVSCLASPSCGCAGTISRW